MERGRRREALGGPPAFQPLTGEGGGEGPGGDRVPRAGAPLCTKRSEAVADRGWAPGPGRCVPRAHRMPATPSAQTS